MTMGQFVMYGDRVKPMIPDQSQNLLWIDMKGKVHVYAYLFPDFLSRTGHSVKPLTEEDVRVRSSFAYQTNAAFNISNASLHNQEIFGEVGCSLRS